MSVGGAWIYSYNNIYLFLATYVCLTVQTKYMYVTMPSPAVQSLAAVPLAVQSLVAVSELWGLLVEPGCVVITIIPGYVCL